MNNQYLPSIDSLRALSIIGVVFYHYELGLSGGFVGVDVFFVISGYLITGIILRELSAGTFSVLRFMARRIRRILPASLVMVFIVLVVGSLLFLRDDLTTLAKSAIAHCAMLANVYFYRDGDYFASPNELKPLLHSWSLAIEEQFYIVYPLALILVYRLMRHRLFAVLCSAFLASLAISIIGVFQFPSATFYLLPTRAWELLLGGILCCMPLSNGLKASWANVVSIVGALMIVAPMVVYSKFTPFPGVAALVPCVGTAAIIITSNNVDCLVTRLLSLSGLRVVGIVSYSLYLWHWPIISFARYVWGVSLGGAGTVAALALSIIVAFLSWKFIENPFRRASRSHSTRLRLLRPLLFGTMASCCVMFFSVGIWLTNGFAGLRTVTFATMMDDVTYRGQAYITERDSSGKFQYLKIGAQDGRGTPQFLLWGDSHALAVAEVFDHLASSRKICGAVAARPGTIPVTFVDRWVKSLSVGDEVATFNDNVVDYVIDSAIPMVVLAARWSVYVEGYSSIDSESATSRDRFGILIRDAITTEKSPVSAAAALERRLSEMITRLRESGVETIVLLEQIPEQDIPSPARKWFFHRRHPWLVSFPAYGSCIEVHLERQKRIDEIFSRLMHNNPSVLVLSPRAYCFDEEGHSILTANGFSCYRDNDHVSRTGAKAVLAPMIDQLLDTIPVCDERRESLSQSTGTNAR